MKFRDGLSPDRMFGNCLIQLPFREACGLIIVRRGRGMTERPLSIATDRAGRHEAKAAKFAIKLATRSAPSATLTPCLDGPPRTRRIHRPDGRARGPGDAASRTWPPR